MYKDFNESLTDLRVKNMKKSIDTSLVVHVLRYRKKIIVALLLLFLLFIGTQLYFIKKTIYNFTSEETQFYANNEISKLNNTNSGTLYSNEFLCKFENHY